MGKRYWIKKLVMAVLLLPALLLPSVLSAQLAILPFTGSQPYDAEELNYLLEDEDVLWNIFGDVWVQDEGMWWDWDEPYQIDSWTAIDWGLEIGASHILMGHIATVSGRNLLLISMIDLYNFQLISGYYIQYRDFDELNIFEIATQFAAAASLDKSELPPLYVPSTIVRTGADWEEVALLSQVLSYELAARWRYAIYPIDYDPDVGNPMEEEGVWGYSLLNAVRPNGTSSNFTADIWDVTGVDHIDWAAEDYSTFAQGLARMPRIALALTDRTGYDMMLRNEAIANRIDPAQARRQRQEDFFYAGGTKFWSVGLSVGTTFETPLALANAAFTASILPYTFFELGMDFGIWPTAEDEQELAKRGHGAAKYHSMYYFGRFNGFLPFGENGGAYAGIGAGYIDHRYLFDEASYQVGFVAFEASTGVFLGVNNNYLRIGYSIRTPTNFSSMGHRVTIGHALRFF